MRRTLLLTALLTALAALCSLQPAHSQSVPVCSNWTQVNDNAFGLPGGGVPPSYNTQDTFEVLTYDSRLYVGMEANNTLGARLWRVKNKGATPAAQADWEEVIADGSGYPFGVSNTAQVDHIDSLQAFNGYMYASTANRTGYRLGTRLFRSSSGASGTWSDAIATYGPGFGDTNNGNFKDMQIFQSQLCGGTGNDITGAEVWCTADGVNWSQKNVDGFGDSKNETVWSGTVYKNALYFGLQNTSVSGGIGKLYRTTSLSGTPTWTQVYSGTAGTYRADLLGQLGDYLYIATRSAAGIVVLRSSSGDLGTWQQVNVAGMNNNAQNSGTVVDGAVVIDKYLYVAVINLSTGLEIWRTSGTLLSSGTQVDWVQASSGGLGDPKNMYAQLISYNSYLVAWIGNYTTGQQVRLATCPIARYIIMLVGDGMGSNHIQAAQDYTGSAAVYESWDKYWVATYPSGGSYDPTQAWSNFNYVITSTTSDSAAAATALFSGQKTSNGRIMVSSDGSQRLSAIADKARSMGLSVGAVTSVPVSHATPGAWYAHNDSRTNGFAIADEGLWGDPNTTGLSTSTHYAGGHGTTLPPVDVLIGGGHPAWSGGTNYANQAILTKLITESQASAVFTFTQRITGTAGGPRLLGASTPVTITRLVGLYGAASGNLDYRLADGSGQNSENPTLAEMTRAALNVLGRDLDGFVLLVEGGAIDDSAHDNNMNEVLGEMIDFNNAAQEVVNWVDANDPAWKQTLVIVVADHETGYLTAEPGVFPDQPLGVITTTTLGKEKLLPSGRRASWEDTNSNNQIDPGETVYWAWNTDGHSNSLVPLFVKGRGATLFTRLTTNNDPQRGAYIDNTGVHEAVNTLLNSSPSAVKAQDISAHAEPGVSPFILVLFAVAAAGLAGLRRRHPGKTG